MVDNTWVLKMVEYHKFVLSLNTRHNPIQ